MAKLHPTGWVPYGHHWTSHCISERTQWGVRGSSSYQRSDVARAQGLGILP